MLEVLTRPERALSPICMPGYRAGMPAPNKGKKYPAEVLTRDEVHRLIAACGRGASGARNRALITLLYRTGLRIAEALALEPKDIDLDAGAVTVLHGKGDRARVVGIDPPAAAVLAQWLERRRALAIPRGAPVFCTISRPHPGRPMYSSVVREMLKDAGERAGIEKRVHPHGLRHTHAAELAREKVPVNLIQRQLGHKSLAVTAHYIDHLMPNEVIDAMRGREDWTLHVASSRPSATITGEAFQTDPSTTSHSPGLP